MSTGIKNKKHDDPEFWGSILRMAKPIARSVFNSLLSTGQDETLLAENENSFGPIEYEHASGSYVNRTNKRVALDFTSTNQEGTVPGSKIDRLFFEPVGETGSTERADVVNELVSKNISGHVSWSDASEFPKEDEKEKAFLHLAKWDGENIHLFDFDHDEENDLSIRINYHGRELTFFARNPTKRYEYILDVILVDCSSNVFNFDVALTPGATEEQVKLGKDFDQRLPIERIFVIGRVVPPEG